MNNENNQYIEELLTLINNETSNQILRSKLEDYHSNDIAMVLEYLTLEQRKRLYKVLGIDLVSEIFTYLDDVELYIAELDVDKAVDIVEEMDADDALDVLQELDEEVREEIIELLDEEVREDIEMISSYDEDVIGSKMTTNFIAIKKDLTIKQAMKEVVKQAAENDNVSLIYVVDEGVFYGVINLYDLVIARDHQVLLDIITTKYPYLFANEKIEDCINKLTTYAEKSIPVLDENKHLLGIITTDDIVEVVAEEISEDYAKLAGLTSDEDLEEPLLKSMQKRIPWLLVLLVLSLIVSSVIQLFQEHIPTSLIILYTFQSLILGMAGNVGTQSLGVTIRVIADNQISGKEKLKFVFKELKVGLLNGFIIGLLAFICIGLFLEFIIPSSIASINVSGFIISACIGFSLFVAMTIASLDGTLVPLLFKKIGIDPAVASGPLITTLNDLVAVCAYYGLSILLFMQILNL